MSPLSKRVLLLASELCLSGSAGLTAADFGAGTVRLVAHSVAQAGSVVPGTERSGFRILANRLDGTCASIDLSFDATSLRQSTTPCARLRFEFAGLQPDGPFAGETPSYALIHAYVLQADGRPAKYAGNVDIMAKPLACTVDVTRVVAEALAGSVGEKRLVFELRLAGEPGPAPIYLLATAAGDDGPELEIAPPDGGEDIRAERVLPVQSGATVYRESCMLLTEKRDSEVTARLLYSVKRVREVIRGADGEILAEGRDWILRRGTVVFPPGTRAPVQFAPEFFAPKSAKAAGPSPPGARRLAFRLEVSDEAWYRDRQVEITYDPAARGWSWPAPASSFSQLPRLARAVAARRPVKIVLFGDSISVGHNASSIAGVPPYQPIWGDLVARELERRWGTQVLLFNHSQSGATSEWAAAQAVDLVAAEKPDLAIIAFGMNDRGPARLARFSANMEAAIAAIRAHSPDTEFLLVATMMNNPKQAGGTAPVLAIRDKTLAISGPGIAHVDMTTTEQVMLEHKSYLDLSGNGLNHPNDFLIGIYAQRVLAVLAPSRPARPAGKEALTNDPQLTAP